MIILVHALLNQVYIYLNNFKKIMLNVMEGLQFMFIQVTGGMVY